MRIPYLLKFAFVAVGVWGPADGSLTLPEHPQLRSSLASLSMDELEDLFQRSIIPTEQLPVGRVVGSMLRMGGLRVVAEFLNLGYTGDLIFKQCPGVPGGPPTPALADIVLFNLVRSVQGLWFINDGKNSTINGYPAAGMVSDFTQPIWKNCHGPSTFEHRNPWPFTNMIDVWRQLPDNPDILLGKAFLTFSPGSYIPYGYILIDTNPLDATPALFKPIRSLFDIFASPPVLQREI